MLEQKVARLEQHIDQLIANCQQLERENAQLREALDGASHAEAQARQERAKLALANDQTRSQIEKMIVRLKALEQGK